MSPLIMIPLALGLVVLLLLVARLAGPVFVWEVVRMARRGRPVGIRALYGLALLAALLVTYARWFPGQFTAERAFAAGPTVEPSQSAQFAESFAATFLVVQFAAVLLLTPAYVAGAIAEERQRRTLEFLCASPLTRREIVLGKLAARMLHLGGALAVGLPVLGVTLLFGGVSPLRLIAGVTVTALTFLSLSALSIFYSVTARTVTGAIARTYLTAATACTFCACVPLANFVNPLVAMGVVVFAPLDADSDWADLGLVAAGLAGYALIHSILAVVLVGSAIRELKAAPAKAGQAPVGLRPPEGRVLAEPQVPTVVRFFPLPPVGDRPLLWKERHFGANAGLGELLHTGCTLAAIFLGSLAVVVLVVVGIEWSSGATVDIPYGVSINPVVRAATVALLGGASLAVGLLAAGSVTGEREGRSLDALLTLPGDRVEVLRAKWQGSLLRARLAVGVMAFLWVMAVLTGALHPLALPLLAVAGTAYILFATSLGLYVSLVSRGTTRANFLVGLVIVLNCLLPVLVAATGRVRLRVAVPTLTDRLSAFVEDGLTPTAVWWSLAFARVEEREALFGGRPSFGEQVGSALAGSAVYALAAWALWRASVRRFEREKGPPALYEREKVSAGPS